MSNQSHSFSGNLTRDPEIRTVNGKNGDVNVAQFTVAVNGQRPEDTVYFDCEVWAQAADVISKWFTKGKPIVINDSEARTDTWNDKTTGEKRSRMKFRVNRFSFVPGGGKTSEADEVGQEATDAGEPEQEAPEAIPVRKPSTTRKPRATVPPEADDDNIPF
jgi:single-strand DNA-binding protein